MLTIYRRHLKTCDHRCEGRDNRRCKCPVWVDGFLGGRDIRESLKTRDWQKASDQVHEWESRGSVEEPKKENEPLTITAAWESFVKDAESRGLQPDSIRKYRHLERLTVEFPSGKELRYLLQFNVDPC